MNIIAITACPTGVAHTYLAEANLKKNAKKMGVDILVETQGAVESEYILTSDDIKKADTVLIAADKVIDLSRFSGKKIIRVPVTRAAKDAQGLLNDILSGKIKSELLELKNSRSHSESESTDQSRSWLSQIYVHLITGVNLMIPFVVAGGILIALSFSFGITAATPGDPHFSPLAKMFSDIGGGAAFALMLPILSLGISKSISGNMGIVSGAVGGMLAIHTGSGFLGALLAGFLAGYVTFAIVKYVNLPKALAGLKPILIVPLLSVLITGALMIFVVGEPIKVLLQALTTFLENLGNTNAAIMGLLIGMMVAFDMGGPLNKTVCMFAIGLMSSGIYEPIAACMAAGMVPPLGIALATLLFRQKFTHQERETGKVTWVLGLSFITEGAIPYAVADPLRVIPAIVAGSGLAGALSMALGCGSRAPHGGIFVMFIPNVITHVVAYACAIAAGAILTALILRFVKKDCQELPQEG
ncbi:PTS system, fructose-specific IIA component [Pantoea sp. AS-PWVM4]|uniref:protein-N(pi)-phosphohistidine--D-fructose phosphotransferase n=1 Tax=Pantoea phytobeneficialis TaxID=2052056 RepID=A0AAP9KNI5_9GAMM|nr:MULTISPECIES: fructose-specific PTS transporter subunit EIIC [Pantoea]ERK18214.1 PTS system, fructose-specific IIA component [Pantoea sp. AS-PWVM4]MDO6408098.1 fructose-specific PTS transporter subunit EIIC [Pantoea phytobeneficialis]QGR05864.1 PTS fructose transporter subunit IIBC [Pantoea phytobeneficialis]